MIDGKLRNDILISENQFSFMPGRSTTKEVHLIRRLMKLYMERKKDLHIVFIDIEKAYDRIPCEVLWEYFEKKDLSEIYI